MVFQFVNVPPSHLLSIYGSPILDASSLIVLLAERFVPTKRTLLPFEQFQIDYAYLLPSVINILIHLWIPESLLMTKMNACLKQVFY
jgi:hypothetical protein